ncbi:hypothetical protein PV772_19155 [Pseudarthrobacter sp. CC12]|uniref:hypothetical protein n=1 Tax=Pseudarthrobacter sp. CC12 TaxID=3029193 RepID=UPI003265F99E
MALRDDVQLSDESDSQLPEPLGPAKSPKGRVTQIDTSTFRKIAEHDLRQDRRDKALADIEAGALDLTFHEAADLMARALAEYFAGQGHPHGIYTELPGEIRIKATEGDRAKSGAKVLPCNVAFEATLGKLRTQRIRAGIKEAMAKISAHRDEAGRRKLRQQLTFFNDKKINYNKIGAGNAFTVADAIQHVIDRVAIAADRGRPPTLAPDILSRIEAARAAESYTADLELTSVAAAALPAEHSVRIASLHYDNGGPLEYLLRWSDSLGNGDSQARHDATELAKQCASMDYLSLEELDRLSDEVARRIHHPFGLLNTAGHADMVTALYLYAGEAPHTAIKRAWAYVNASDAAHHLQAGNYEQLVTSVLASLDKTLRKNAVRWMQKVQVRPSAVDLLRLLSATAAQAAVDPKNAVWPDGLMDEVLRHYGVNDDEIPMAAELLKDAFSLARPEGDEVDWWEPSLQWNTVGSRILQRIATFDYTMSEADLEDLRAHASQTLALTRLTELRSNLVRAESSFPQTIRGKEDRGHFTRQSVEATNKWLWKQGGLQAASFFKRVKNEKNALYGKVRGLGQSKASQSDLAVAAQARRKVAHSQTSSDWFSIATGSEAIALLRKDPTLGSDRGIRRGEARSAADRLLNILGVAAGNPESQPADGQGIGEWIDEQVERLNALAEDLDDLIHPSHSTTLSILLEETVRATNKEAGK